MGRPNLYNIAAAIGVAQALSISYSAIKQGIRNLPNVPGRFEIVASGQQFRVIVDYAHTDDALEKVLNSARGSDYTVVTSDNPRSEDPMAIIAEIEKGMKGARYTVVPDRREAIRTALSQAMPNDTVVIAGKGHETYQTIGTASFPFDDRVVARELLDELVAGRN